VPIIAGSATVVSVSKPAKSSARDEFFRNGEAQS
jgi:hypothetical protein